MVKEMEFLKNAILGKKVGAISRSSRYVIKKVLNNIKGQTFHKIVEYGPGDGVLTHELLKMLSPNGKMLVVELDKNFVEILNKINDPRLIVIEGKMEDVAKNLSLYAFDSCDLIVSSIPFSLIDKKDREDVVKNSYKSLKEEGKFIIFHQYSVLMKKPLQKYFKNIKIDFEPRNLFPWFVMSAGK